MIMALERTVKIEDSILESLRNLVENFPQLGALNSIPDEKTI